jgi:hypothetical protein
LHGAANEAFSIQCDNQSGITIMPEKKSGIGAADTPRNSEAIDRYLSDLRARTKSYETGVDTTRKLLDLATPGATLTDFLYRMRRENDVL